MDASLSLQQSKDWEELSCIEARIRIFAAGPETGPVCALFNAHGMPVTAMRPLALALAAEGFRAISWTTTDTDDGFELELHTPHAQMLRFEALRASLGRDIDILVGWCTGALLSLMIAADHWPTLRAVIGINGSFNLSPGSTYQRANMRVMRAAAIGRAAAATLHKVIQGAATLPMHADTDSDETAKVRKLLGFPVSSPDSLYRYALFLVAIARVDVDEYFARVRVPCMFLLGQDDQVSLPAESAAAAGKLPSAKLLAVPGGDHFIHMRQPTEVARAIKSYVDGLPVRVGQSWEATP